MTFPITFRGWRQPAVARPPFDPRRAWRRAFLVLQILRALRILGERAAARRAYLEKQQMYMYGSGTPRCATPGCSSNWYYVQKNGHCTACNANRTRQAPDFSMMDTLRRAVDKVKTAIRGNKEDEDMESGLADEEYAMMQQVEWQQETSKPHAPVFSQANANGTSSLSLSNLRLHYNLSRMPPQTNTSSSLLDSKVVDQLVRHASSCAAADEGHLCPTGGCAEMRRVLHHTTVHPYAEPNCTDCIKTYRILISHAERCGFESPCLVPRCEAVKLHLQRKAQTQMVLPAPPADGPQLCWVRTPQMSWWPAIQYPLNYPLPQLPQYVLDQYQEGCQIVCFLGDRQFACIHTQYIMPWSQPAQPTVVPNAEVCTHPVCEDLRSCLGYVAPCIFLTHAKQQQPTTVSLPPLPPQAPRTGLPSLQSIFSREPKPLAHPPTYDGIMYSPEVHMKKRKLIQTFNRA
ncbi:hypothetical protein SPRG_08213 [Saprolegnia parasitica CBS 223.65]|uniref:TAZ-type domain-containing protein n=1 Tax=Saprolegnia parasitica (strain CBS 223.65) TaxID=695850 RepID=A0A067CB43_SAPPC|nr:hypothetical protein SPRG_08213 [Saprolegnia parasitica CBS 223.65]KDO26410.1 hypothetical protein SPRG_08213 [Saprolegnia parasitica CBS 223.65]|eukprot:XP_012202847.1 hypothetical protein SPRG_08213 [Saprolegnia parasitica CBS 223.65]